MADVFLSYSNKDRAMAARVERALTAAGYEVFWDQETPTGKDWNSWIREKLGLAKVVVVLWSKASVSSNNVVHEATIALKGAKLIPALIEALDAEDFPMGMFTVQGANLRGYNGGDDHPGMAKLLAAVADKIGGREAAVPQRRRRSPILKILAAVVVLVVAGLGAAIVADVAGWTRTNYASYDVIIPGPVNGLATGSDVMFQGVAVGSVSAMNIYKADPNLVMARIRINAQVPLRTSTVAEIYTLNSTGAKFINLKTGDPRDPLLARNEKQPPEIRTAEEKPPPRGAAALVGDWHWTGLACGQGPRVAAADGVLTVTMNGVPTFKHAIEAEDGGVVRTVVVEPDDSRGQSYTLTLSGAALEVKNTATGQIDTWEKCP